MHEPLPVSLHPWIPAWLQAAYFHARRSPDPSTQNGAVVVGFDEYAYELLGMGHNHLPARLDPARGLGAAKYPLVQHAETSALRDAGRLGHHEHHALVGCWVACLGCAAAIIDAGIDVVVRHRDFHDAARGLTPRWNDELDAADTLFAESGVQVLEHVGPLGPVAPIRIGGVLWHAEVGLAAVAGAER